MKSANVTETMSLTGFDVQVLAADGTVVRVFSNESLKSDAFRVVGMVELSGGKAQVFSCRLGRVMSA